MTKAKTLAALAGLAGLAYANRDKLFGGKDKDDKRTDARSPGDEMSVYAANRGMPDEEPRRKIESYIKKAPEDEKGSAQSDVLKAVTAAKEAPNDKAPNQGVIPPKSSGKSAAAKQAPSGRREDEAGMGRGTRGADASKAYPSGVMGGARQADTAKNTDYSNEGRSSTAPTIASKVGDVVKTVAKTAYSGVPTSEQASANRQAAMDRVKGFGKGVVDYVSNFETPAERAARERKEASGMKRGGMTKMASGGMTASRRGDGIASRGKTRGKIC
jgi:hypothetical protein